VADVDYTCLQFRLADRFGDNGLVSVIIVEHDTQTRDTGSIANWVMSCRVFGRQFEFAIMNVVVPLLVARGMKQLRAEFRETDRNHVIAGLFEKIGFVPNNEVSGSKGESQWILHLDEFNPLPTHIDSEGFSI
jgi:FkbH-like protein